MRWGGAIAFAVAIHAGAGAYLLYAARPAQEGTVDGAIPVELTPYLSEPSEKPDDVAGPKVEGAGAGQTAQAEDQEPPAPESPPPTAVERKPETAPELTAPPAPTPPDAIVPPDEKPKDRAPDAKPDDKPDVKKDVVERQSAPSRASNGSFAPLEGGKHASAAAKATWAGAVGTHIARLRRYPKAAREEGWQGTTRIRVTIDGDGHVKDRSIVKSSGRPILDDEALALMQRSDPFPKPPAGMATPVALTVPVNFALR